MTTIIMESNQESNERDSNLHLRANVLLRLQIQKSHDNLNNLSSYFKSLQDENAKLSSFTQKVEIPDYPLPEDTFLDSIEKSLHKLSESRKSSIFDFFRSFITVLLVVLIGIVLSKFMQKSKSLISIF